MYVCKLFENYELETTVHERTKERYETLCENQNLNADGIWRRRSKQVENFLWICRRYRSRDRSGVISGLYILQADNDRDFSQWKRHILAIVDDQNYNSLPSREEDREISNDFTPGNNHLICH